MARTKSDLIRHLAIVRGLTQVEAAAALDTVLSFVTLTVDAGDKLTIKGFGTFELRERKARMGRNPRTGEPVAIAGSMTIGFRAAKKAGA